MKSRKTQLVLDAAGVLIGNLTPLFWEAVAVRSKIDVRGIKHRFKLEMRQELWTGQAREEDFWVWMENSFPGSDRNELLPVLQRAIQPLPAWYRLEDWSQVTDLHLLSNHCWEWLAPMLEPMEPFIRSVTISSRTGYCKPDPAIFRIVETYFPSGAQVIYVDDQNKNLEAARSMGWETILADSGQHWLNSIEELYTAKQKTSEDS